MNEIGILATGIYTYDFEDDASVPRPTVGRISGWLQEHLGDLNLMIHTSYSGENPSFDLESAQIYKSLYLSHYYTLQGRKALMGVLNSDKPISIREADASITFTNKKELAKEINKEAERFYKQAKMQASNYNAYQAVPLQVGGWDGSFSGYLAPIWGFGRYDDKGWR